MANIKKKKLRTLQKEIQWFLSFISINDIKKLSKSDRSELASTIEKYTRYQKLGEHQEYEPIASSFMEHLVGLTDPIRLVSFQKRIADFFGFMKTKIRYTFDLEEKGWTTPENTDFHPISIKETVKIKYNITADGLRYDKKEENGRPASYRLIPESLQKATFTTTYDSSIAENFFLYSFINLINGIPISAFKECPGCGNWFVNLTKRKRTYCNNRCSARNGKRRERAKSKIKREAGDTDEIKKYERELMEGRFRSSKKYGKQVRKKYPKAKIQRRPRKPYPPKK